jgi:CheY-like chemotaxis protein
MSTPLLVLILEDNLADFDLIVHELERFGLEARFERVGTEADFALRLLERPDLILAEHSL